MQQKNLTNARQWSRHLQGVIHRGPFDRPPSTPRPPPNESNPRPPPHESKLCPPPRKGLHRLHLRSRRLQALVRYLPKTFRCRIFQIRMFACALTNEAARRDNHAERCTCLFEWTVTCTAVALAAEHGLLHSAGLCTTPTRTSNGDESVTAGRPDKRQDFVFYKAHKLLRDMDLSCAVLDYQTLRKLRVKSTASDHLPVLLTWMI
eukprot:m.143684 g.143684  ORF g.143684 m.143684 type:complete len:205 (+) comp17702_c0_seq8:1370-1984(+)